MEIDRRRRDILVVDHALSDADLGAIEGVVASAEFESQDLNRGAFTARQRAVVESPQIAEVLWDARVGSRMAEEPSLRRSQFASISSDPPRTTR
jgi:hypothetical protein